MADDPLQSVDLDQPLTLVVGWREGRTVQGGQVNLTREVAEALREVCRHTARLLGDREAKPYSADAHLEAEEYLVVVVAADDLDTEIPIPDLIRTGPELPRLAAPELPKKSLLFYAAVFGTSPADRVGFIRKTNPHQTAHAGRVFTTLRDALTVVEEPVFVFDGRMDLVLTPGELIVLTLTAFEQLFRDLEVLLDRIPEWLGEVAAHLPMSVAAFEELEKRCGRDGRLRRRLLAIHGRGHLATVTVRDISDEATRQGLDPGQLLHDGELVIGEDVDAGTLLKLLNEDLMTGGLSGARFAVERKAPR